MTGSNQRNRAEADLGGTEPLGCGESGKGVTTTPVNTDEQRSGASKVKRGDRQGKFT